MGADPRGRLRWLDAARGIGIALVLLGHSPAVRGTLQTLVYAFHMPLFFFVSGYAASASRLEVPFRSYLATQARRLLVPYFAFSALSYPIWLVALASGKTPSPGVTPLRPLLGTLYGNGTEGWLDHNVALWFFVCLFDARLIFFWIVRLGSLRAVALAVPGLAALGAAAAAWPHARLPWSLDVAPVAAVFLCAGFLVRHAALPRARLPGLRGWMALPAAAALVGLALWNGRVDMNGQAYGNPLLFYAAAAAGILMTCAAAVGLAEAPLLGRVGRNAAAIFPSHLPLFTVFTGLAVFGLGLPSTFNDRSVLIALGYTLLGLVVLTPFGEWLRRFAPWLIGEARDAGAAR